jgi:hypothetical protein
MKNINTFRLPTSTKLLNALDDMIHRFVPSVTFTIATIATIFRSIPFPSKLMFIIKLSPPDFDAP